MNLSPEDRKIGKENYLDVVGYTRRDFLMSSLAAGVGSTAAAGALYFGYDAKLSDPVRIGFIGSGDEGNILIGALNPNYVDLVALCDIRPSSIHRAFHGDWGGGVPEVTHALRPGMMQVYGWKTEDEARQHVTLYQDYKELLKQSNIEAVIIALPLHLHAAVAIAALQAGKHVLTEKLMAHNIAQGKVMARVADQTKLHLATGHQRHYSVLYDDARHILKSGLLGQLHYIRAQWHRGNLPGKDSWKPPLPGGDILLSDDPRRKLKKGETFDQIAYELKKFQERLPAEKDPKAVDLLRKQIAQWTSWDADKRVEAEAHGYEKFQLPQREVTALEELIRWRLWDRTGGGLMAELGSHQLDAASIFVSAMRDDGKKVHPLTVHAVGGRQVFPQDRDCDDHVYCTFEYPAPGYDAKFEPGYDDRITGVPDLQTGIPAYDPEKHPQNRVVVTYSSINGNGFGGYGEVVMGTKGTLILEREEDLMIYKDSDTQSRVGVKPGGGGAVLDTQASGATAPLAQLAKSGPVSRGYKEEIEHWAWCIRNPAPENRPRCYPAVALGDAVIALSTRVAIRNGIAGKGGFLPFDEAWFDPARDETPDGSQISEETQRLKA